MATTQTSLLVLANILLVVCQGQELQCHVEGQCSGIVVGGATTETYNHCLDLCKANEDCHWITYLGATQECAQLYDCPSLDKICENCFSGQSECEREEPLCDAPGFCNGHFVTANHTSSAEDCLSFCLTVPECRWYSFFPSSNDCFLTGDCLFVDDTCSDCVYGERECLSTTPEGPSGPIFVVGGQPPAAYKNVEIIYPNGPSNPNCPTELPDIPINYGSVGTYLTDFGVLVCGGFSCYTYDQAAGSWQPTHPMSTQRSHPAAVQLSPTSWWVTGGNTATTEIFDVATGWSDYVDLPTVLEYHNLVSVSSTEVVLLGGSVNSNQAWLFNTETEAWTSLPNLIRGVSYGQAGLVTLPNGDKEVVVAAGQSTNVTQIFSFDTMTWRLGAAFPTGNNYGGEVVQHGDTFLLLGGSVIAGSYQNLIHSYDVESGEWVERPERLAVARTYFAAFSVPDDYLQC